MDSNESRARALLGDLSAGCSAVAWETADGGHLWGRNFDFNRIAADSKVTFVPRGQVFYACGTELEGNLEPSTRCTAAYAAVGIGSLVLRSTPALYEGLNEKGLMGGQLYYRTFAHFAPEARPGTLPLQPPFLVTWCLATCASVEEVARALEERVSLVAIPMLGTVPPIHWMFSDRTGESIVVESDRDGLHIYRNTVGVMTNSPGYPWHRTNLLNHPQLRPLDYGELAWGGERLEPCFSGSGAAGLPGDWSSPSRFVRLLTGPEEITPHDRGVVPYDYTVYSSVLCAESMRFYWLTYRNSRVRYVELSRLLKGDRPLQFALGEEPEFCDVTGEGV